MRGFPSSRSIGRTDSQSQFFYTNAVYDQAYKAISSALRAQMGLILLTGDAGTGKTKLIGLISTTLEEQIYFCRCDFLPTTLWELLSVFDEFLALPDRGSEVSPKLEAITDRLRMWAYRKRITVLVIDDAHRLSTEVLNQLSLLLDLDSTFGSLLQIVLVGRPDLETKLATPELHHVQARVAVRAQLTPLQTEEVRPFIDQRYRTPRGLRQYLFTPEAIDRIADYSQTIPGRITLLSESALVAAYAQGQKVVTPEVVVELAVKLFSSPNREAAPQPSVPTPEPLIEDADLPRGSFQRSEILHLRHRVLRFGRALVMIGLCAVLLLAGLIVGKHIAREQLTTVLPLVIETTKRTLSFFPRLISINFSPVRQANYQDSLQGRPQNMTDFKQSRQ